MAVSFVNKAKMNIKYDKYIFARLSGVLIKNINDDNINRAHNESARPEINVTT